MGYDMYYDGDKTVRHHRNPLSKQGRMLIGIVTAAVIFMAVRVVGVEKVKHFLIPGDPAVTAPAFHNFVEQVQQGRKVAEAFSDFCVEIVSHADLG